MQSRRLREVCFIRHPKETDLRCRPDRYPAKAQATGDPRVAHFIEMEPERPGHALGKTLQKERRERLRFQPGREIRVGPHVGINHLAVVVIVSQRRKHVGQRQAGMLGHDFVRTLPQPIVPDRDMLHLDAVAGHMCFAPAVARDNHNMLTAIRGSGCSDLCALMFHTNKL